MEICKLLCPRDQEVGHALRPSFDDVIDGQPPSQTLTAKQNNTSTTSEPGRKIEMELAAFMNEMMENRSAAHSDTSSTQQDDGYSSSSSSSSNSNGSNNDENQPHPVEERKLADVLKLSPDEEIHGSVEVVPDCAGDPARQMKLVAEENLETNPEFVALVNELTATEYGNLHLQHVAKLNQRQPQRRTNESIEWTPAALHVLDLAVDLFTEKQLRWRAESHAHRKRKANSPNTQHGEAETSASPVHPPPPPPSPVAEHPTTTDATVMATTKTATNDDASPSQEKHRKKRVARVGLRGASLYARRDILRDEEVLCENSVATSMPLPPTQDNTDLRADGSLAEIWTDRTSSLIQKALENSFFVRAC